MLAKELRPRIETIPEVSERTRRLMRDSVVVDALLPWSPRLNGDQFDLLLPRWRKAGVTCISLTMAYRGFDEFTAVTDWTSRVRQQIADAEGMRLVESIADINSCHANGDLGLYFNFQDALPIGRQLHLAQLFYDLGVRQIGLAYNLRNFVGDGGAEEANGGLSRFGRALVAELNRVGIIVDGSHAGHRTTMDAMEITTKPFIFSHSNPHAVRPHYRSVQDDQMKAAAATGGTVGINGVGFWTGDIDATTESIFRCVDYAVQLIGDDHVHLGFDYIWDLDELFKWTGGGSSLLWPPYKGELMVKHNYAGPEQIVDLVEHMVQHGYRDSTIEKILGRNYLRVAAATWVDPVPASPSLGA
jgi:membrane dipeptidase